MKFLITLFFSSFFIAVHAQEKPDMVNTLQEFKNKSHIDETDSTMLELYHQFYIQTLQNDEPAIRPELINQIKTLMSAPRTKNLYLLMSILMYQEAILASAQKKIKLEPETQLRLINFIEQEFQSLYNQTPAIVYIFKTESLQQFRLSPELLKNMEDGLKAYPECIPLKVYLFNNYKNEAVKKDLLQNHSSHWLVKLQPALAN